VAAKRGALACRNGKWLPWASSTSSGTPKRAQTAAAAPTSDTTPWYDGDTNTTHATLLD
jgi:hypothetical protein